jgi:hypothetical protein
MDRLDMSISEKMKDAQFCICARGGGYDPSPKAWSALINGCIPIIQHSPVDEAYSRFPVVFVDDWTPESLSEDKLNWLNKEHMKIMEVNSRNSEIVNRLKNNSINSVISLLTYKESYPSYY